jgi:soluble lytic murein transglycosylase
MRLMKFSNAFLLILTAIFSVNLFAQNLAETHQKILKSVENRDYQTAVSELDALKKSDKKIFELNNYDYLLARISEKKGDFAAAMANYQAVANRNSVLKEYALWHLSQIARSSGNLLLERTFLQEILAFAPESLLTDAVKIRQARSYFEGKNYDTAIQFLNNLQTGISNQKAATSQTPIEKNPRYRENLVLLGEAYLQSGKPTEAREVFTKLTNNLPNPGQPDDFALAGAKGLDKLDAGENYGKVAPNLPDFEHLRRALIYNFNRDFTDARLHYQTIVKDYPQSGNVPDALYQIGRGYAQEANFVEAINWFERVQEQFPDHPSAKDALSQTASAYARVNKPKEAITRYQKFIEKYADAENIERAYLNIVDIERDLGEESDALKWTAKTQEVFKGKLPEAITMFAQMRIHIAQNDWQNALTDADKLLTFADLGGTRVPGGTNKAEVTFLKAFALEQLQRYSEAIDVYLSIPDGRAEYYGWRSTERLKELDKIEQAQPHIEEAIKKNLIVADQEKLPQALGRADELNNMRKAAQNVMRLTTKPEILTRINTIIGSSYYRLPNYANFKAMGFSNLAGQCFMPPSPYVGAKSEGWEKNLYGRCELRTENRLYEPKRKGHFIIVEELIFLGLFDQAAPELAAALGANGSFANLSKEDASSLAFAFKRGEMANFAVAYIEPLFKNAPADYLIEMIPRQVIELLYPVPYADSLVKYAPERNVDPRFVLSIMRQESRYRADVKSYAAARGLMQFISTTSDKIAGELGRENFKQDELYNPPTAILFGSQYLADIYKQFPGQHAAVAASYNGGEDNVKRWITRSKSDLPDRYIPEIIFSQSKDYAYKVMANFRVYQIFYDENLKVK